MQRSSVVLPAPLGPTRAVMEPVGNVQTDAGKRPMTGIFEDQFADFDHRDRL